MKDNYELDSTEQTRMRDIVRALPEEPVSMAWRSSLNDKLRAASIRRKRLDLFGWIWKPTVGVAVTGALALAFMVRLPMPDPVQPRQDVEKALVSSYVDSAASYEVAGDNVSAGEARDAAANQPVKFDLGQEDVGATL